MHSSHHFPFFLYDDLCPSYRAFSLSLATRSIPKLHVKTMQLPPKKATMDLEYEGLV